MATYCSVRDVRLALTPGGSATDGSTAASLEDYQIDDAIREAEETIDLFLATRYTITPVETEEVDPTDPTTTWTFSVAPAPLRGWTRDLAAFLATLTFRRNKDIPADDPVRLRFNMVMGFLSQVRDGSLSLTLPVPDSVAGITVQNLYEGRLFDMSNVGLGYDYSRAQRIDRLAPWEV